ncbi:MAG TPA: zinc-binding dehydrogenase [Chlamydiales bacterium]|nr:zinc-binding dehydrogenase [Chlamydiales bacterium]
MVQLAKNVMGAKKVVAIVGSDEKAEWIKGLGADVAVNYKHANWRQELTDATPEFAET